MTRRRLASALTGPTSSRGTKACFQLRDSCPRDPAPEGTDAHRGSDRDECSSDSDWRNRAAGHVRGAWDWTPGLDGVRLGHCAKREAKHLAAVANTLQWADEAAERGDHFDAVAWLETLEAIGDQLPEVYESRRGSWSAQIARTQDKRRLTRSTRSPDRTPIARSGAAVRRGRVAMRVGRPRLVPDAERPDAAVAAHVVSTSTGATASARGHRPWLRPRRALHAGNPADRRRTSPRARLPPAPPASPA